MNSETLCLFSFLLPQPLTLGGKENVAMHFVCCLKMKASFV